MQEFTELLRQKTNAFKLHNNKGFSDVLRASKKWALQQQQEEKIKQKVPRSPSPASPFVWQTAAAAAGAPELQGWCFFLCFLAEGDLLHLIREMLHSESLTEYYTSIRRVQGREPFARSDFLFPPYSPLFFCSPYFFSKRSINNVSCL